MKMAVFWVVAPYRAMIALMIVAANTSETSASFYHITRRNNPENSHLQEKCIHQKYPLKRW
jgi:hypothetical protein